MATQAWFKKRTVFYDVSKGHVRFWDWAVVETSLGQMVEPFQPWQRYAAHVDKENFDPEDESVQITEMHRSSIYQHQLILGHGQHLHGGSTDGRVGP